MKTVATVIATDGRIATVETERTSACEGCHKNADGKSCSVCSLVGGERKFTARAYNEIGAKVGDRVMIESRTERVIWYAVLVFVLPLLVALLGARALTASAAGLMCICSASSFCEEISLFSARCIKSICWAG